MSSNLKILTWNCNGAFRKKREFIQSFDADIPIIQECENPEKSSDFEYKNWANNFYWTGDNNNKGLGIFAKQHINIVNLDWENNGEKHFISCRVNNDFNLLAA